MVVLPPGYNQEWPQRIQAKIPGVEVKIFPSTVEAFNDIKNADCVYGEVPLELFKHATRLRWIQCYAAGPPSSFYHQALVDSDVVVTNFKGVYHDSVGHHAVGLLLVLARGLHTCLAQQSRREWKPLKAAVHLPDSTVLIIGVGSIGSEVARLCKYFGTTTIGLDPSLTEKPDYLDQLYPSQKLNDLLPRADFVVLTTPDTPSTRKMITTARLNLMKSTAFLINVGRGSCVVLEDLVQALRSGKIAGAGLDVFETEPLPTEHPLWTLPNAILTPHIAAYDAPYIEERKTQILLTNCERFAHGEPLMNVVNKQNRY